MPLESEGSYIRNLPYFSNKWPQFKKDDNWIKEVV